ncbi:MAG TPA: hypothetical protein VGE35_01020 [Candidatus Paceibacterota bacterium]
MNTSPKDQILFVSPNISLANIIKAQDQMVSYMSICPMDGTDTPAKIVDEARTRKPRAVVIDNRNIRPVLISPANLLLAEELEREGIQTFFALADAERARFSVTVTAVWHARKRVAFHRSGTSSCLVKIGSFGSVTLSSETGRLFPCSGGDSGLEDLQLALQSGRAVDECDWSKAFPAIIVSCDESATA